jgi:Uma2 family endonuclease
MSTVVKNLERDARLYGVANLPESDGKPMAETPKHLQEMKESLNVLEEYFRLQSDVTVYANIFVYYLDENGLLKRVSPDILVARGVANDQERRVYAVEREGKGPDLVIEFTSKKTKKIDLGRKRRIYAWLEVKEYFLFDPYGEYLKPRFQGFQLIGGEYVPMTMAASEPRLYSEVLDLDLVVEGNSLRFYDSHTGERLRTYREAEVERRQEAAFRKTAERKAQQEALARQTAEEKAQQEALARRTAEEKAQQEALARQTAEEKAQQEAAARQTAEAELARLREELARRR